MLKCVYLIFTMLLGGNNVVTNRENLFKLGKKITDRIPYKLGFKKVDEECPEYLGFVNVLNDEMVEVALTMKVRTP